ncbi:MAG: hypothetical protein OXC40_06580 [Proteobacteria bacterium]|nr:hypothetical protein [Pseudomonadota bacterium]
MKYSHFILYSFKLATLLKLGRLLLCVFLVLVMLPSWLLIAQPVNSRELKVDPDNPSDFDRHQRSLDHGIQLYDRGEFGRALQEVADVFAELKSILPHTTTGNTSFQLATIFYNLGNMFARAGGLEQAYFCYLQAYHYLPHDSDVIHNIDFIAQKIGVPSITAAPPYPTRTALLLDDHIVWLYVLLVATGLITVVVITLLLRLLLKKHDQLSFKVFFSVAAASVVVLSAGVITFLFDHSQSKTRDTMDVICCDNVDLYSTPGVSRVSLLTLPKGSVVLWDQLANTLPRDGDNFKQEESSGNTLIKAYVLVPAEIQGESRASTSSYSWFPGWLQKNLLVRFHQLSDPQSLKVTE